MGEHLSLIPVYPCSFPTCLFALGCAGWPLLAPICTHQPSFILTTACSCLSPFFCWSLFIPACLSAFSCASQVSPHSCLLLLIHACLHSFAGPHFPLICPPLSCTGWPSCSLLLVCALCHSFMLITLCFLVLVCPCPCLLGCACPYYLVVLVWLSLMLIGVCLGSFVVTWLLFVLVCALLCSFML